MQLTSPVTDIKGVGKDAEQKLAILGIHTVSDLINYYPRRYDDYSNVQAIRAITPGMVTIKATIKQAAGRYVRRGMHITEAVASDDSGSTKLVWFNQPYRAAALKPDTDYYISGDFGLRSQRLSILNPSVELVGNFVINTARIVPIYRETKGLKSGQIRKYIREVSSLVNSLPETLPEWLVDEERLISRSEALSQIHFPASSESLSVAKRRLGFEEVFELTLSALMNKYELLKEHTSSITFDKKLAQEFVRHLPFTMTDDQKRVVWQIYQDLQKEIPMNRLVEGDVGSGKTVVAAMAAVMAIKQGFQVAFMAPTELLARQHAETIAKLLEPLGMGALVGLLVGGLKPVDKKRAHSAVASGEMMFIVGTHAIIAEKVDMHNLGLVIIDEQHRFGVQQRKKLETKVGHAVHVLSMTATPIPRSLALTLYGELDVSIISTKPANRKPIKTKLVPFASRAQLYESLKDQLVTGRQVFVVCPLVSPSDMVPAKSAEKVYDELSKKFLKDWRVGLLHGQMKSAAKEAVMQAFLDHKLDVLVSTTVIEVGVDVPNAGVMIIESAERFGLAQIHQLRGRVGRSEHQGYCFLVLSDNKAPSSRLRAVQSSSDGFKLAEYDLELRGPGAIYGTMQHGQLDLRIAKLSDVRLIASARKAAQSFLDKGESLGQFKELEGRVLKAMAVTNLN
ncbi:MAG: ATP-dependent DNA helicase RecG [Candidatus Saccharimonadales bacterium]